ncbi:MAG: rRNA maturation RNase YbeY [Chloroflexota bacterium]
MTAPGPPLVLDFELVQDAPPPADFRAEAAARFAEFALRREGAAGPWIVTVALVDDARLRELHRAFMGIDEPTDIMTFPADEPGAGGGDIAISVDRAAEQGPAHGNTPAAEVMFLIAHGLLHLCGWDDASAGDREAMIARQAELIAEFSRS